MISVLKFNRVLKAVDRSGVHTELEALLHPTGHGGRPRQLRADVFVAALIVCAAHYKDVALTNVHRVLTVDLDKTYREQLGVQFTAADGTPQTISVRQVRYLLDALENMLTTNPSQVPGLSEVERVERAEKLDRIVNAILGVSHPPGLAKPSVMAMDATAMQSWGKGKRRPVAPGSGLLAPGSDTRTSDGDTGQTEVYSIDPDAAWGYCTKTYDNKTKNVFGYAMVTTVGVPDVGAAPGSMPILTWRMSLSPANADVVVPGLGLIDGLRRSRHHITELIDDRGFSGRDPKRWADPLRDRGINHVFDLFACDHGVKDHDGVRMIDGTPHCPATPDDLVMITRPAKLGVGTLPRDATAAQKVDHKRQRKELATFRARIAAREQYAFRRVAGPDKTGKERWECPARSAKVVCANCPLSSFVATGDADSPPQVVDPPAIPTAPTCCRQTTVTIAGDVTAKIRQRLYGGSDRWIASFKRRTHVEASYGNLKNPKTENIRRGWCFVVGLVKTSILVAAAMAAVNIRLLRAWAATSDFDDVLCEADPKGNYFIEYDADGNPVSVEESDADEADVDERHDDDPPPPLAGGPI